MGLQVLKIAVRNWAIALSVCLVLPGCNKEARLPYYNTPDLTPVWEKGSGKHTIASFRFTNQEGEEITGDSFAGKIYVADFFFTSCPGICPKMKNNMQLVADTFKKNEQVKFISHSVTPYIDSVSRLKEYADIHHIDARQWHLVTGVKADIYDIARKSYFAEEEMGFNYDSSDFLHTERFVLVDKDKHIRGVYNGTVKLDMEKLIADIRLLLDE